MQTVDLGRLDQYLESVSDQEQALQDSDSFAGRLVLRSQTRPDRFWVIDAWTEQYALESAAILLRTLSSVAAIVEPPREIPTEQVPVGTRGLVMPGDALRSGEEGLPFFLIVENRVKAVCVPEYLELQHGFAQDLEGEQGYGHRMLLRDTHDDAHFFVIDAWRSERAAFEAFERRQATVSEITMTRFLALISERGERDFALGIHG